MFHVEKKYLETDIQLYLITFIKSVFHLRPNYSATKKALIENNTS